MNTIDFAGLREKMVYEQMVKRGIDDERVLETFRSVPREKFVPVDEIKYAYEDYPLSIGMGQTISQPYMVALMTQLLALRGRERILEIGTGSGYQAAILAAMGAEVFSVERLVPLAERAKELFHELGYEVFVHTGDGTLGWKNYAPYDRIIVTAATFEVPSPLREQLKVGGRIIIPLGASLHQDLTVIYRISEKEFKEEKGCGCVFVPLVGKYGYQE